MLGMTILSEEEIGTCDGNVHPHNGYFAGDFSARDGVRVAPLPTESAPPLVGLPTRRTDPAYARRAAGPLGLAA
jgi:hypothetical protein